MRCFRNFAFHDVPGRVAFWQRRAVRDDGSRLIWYAMPDPDHPTNPRESIRGKPPNSLTDRCVHAPDADLWELLKGGRGSPG